MVQAEMQKAAAAAMTPAAMHTLEQITRPFVTVSQQPLMRQVPVVVLIDNGKRINFDAFKSRLAADDGAFK